MTVGSPSRILGSSARSGLATKLADRARDIPWDLAELCDKILPTTFGAFYRRVRPYTMLSNARLRALHRAIRRIAAGVPGDVVECGSARGGSAALLRLALQRYAPDRHLWVFDTFEGLPAPSSGDPDYEKAKRFTGECVGTIEEVEELFRQLGVRDNVTLVKGLFQETLAKTQIERIAVLHLDGDWYDSTLVCLEHLYERVSPGGVIQIDDFGHWAGARKAVGDFFASRGGTPRLRYVDYTGRVIIKPGA